MARNEEHVAYTLNSYQRDASRTLDESRKLDDHTLSVGGLGLAGETGEVVDLIKKVVSHGHPLDRIKLVEEMGDVLWYLAMLCTLLGVSMEDMAFRNIDKLKRRYPNGFETHRSINRES